MPPLSRHLATVSETTAALIEEERLEKAMEARTLRRDGYDWWEIADKMRLTPKGAREAVAYGIKAAADLVNDATKAELLELEVSRLDALMKSVWTDALAGDEKKGKFALEVIRERVKLLELDQGQTAVGQTTVVVGGTSTEYLAALQSIAAHAGTHDTIAGQVESTEPA